VLLREVIETAPSFIFTNKKNQKRAFAHEKQIKNKKTKNELRL
jgi:hypothetical protein